MLVKNSFNYAREISVESFMETIAYGKCQNVFTEKQFMKHWIKCLEKNQSVIADGWYNPPPYGMAILSGGIEYPSRISFASLRTESNWPKDIPINWSEGLLYAYSSAVNKHSGMPGDFALTLYFGKDNRIINHFKNTYQATMEVIEQLESIGSSKELYITAETIFKRYNLKNCVISKTDIVPTDLGHTLPVVLGESCYRLSKKDIDLISKSRCFINAYSDWKFDDGMQFTIEPQLVSTQDCTLPQVSYHFLINKDGQFQVADDVKRILQTYNLI